MQINQWNRAHGYSHEHMDTRPICRPVRTMKFTIYDIEKKTGRNLIHKLASYKWIFGKTGN